MDPMIPPVEIVRQRLQIAGVPVRCPYDDSQGFFTVRLTIVQTGRYLRAEWFEQRVRRLCSEPILAEEFAGKLKDEVAGVLYGDGEWGGYGFIGVRVDHRHGDVLVRVTA